MRFIPGSAAIHFLMYSFLVSFPPPSDFLQLQKLVSISQTQQLRAVLFWYQYVASSGQDE
jgi:hypothetical protein